MTSKDRYIVREGRTGQFVTLPSGRRVHSLDREVFDRAVDAANTYISDRGADRTTPRREDDRPVRRREPA